MCKNVEHGSVQVQASIILDWFLSNGKMLSTQTATAEVKSFTLI